MYAPRTKLQHLYFYPRPPRGGRHGSCCGHGRGTEGISIHALREEGDGLTMQEYYSKEISIHALREEGDTFTYDDDNIPYNFYPRPPRGGRQTSKWSQTKSVNFYPRPPRGGRPSKLPKTYTEYIFLSTPSARRATMVVNEKVADRTIFLSTPSARRATAGRLLRNSDRSNFYPRPPRGGRRSSINSPKKNRRFLSTPSARRAT